MSAKPRNVAIAVDELAVAWSDGHESYYPLRELRRDCPCATCRARPPEVGDVSIAKMTPVGSYGLQITWSDGHDTGIHAWEELRRACPCCRAV